MATISFSGNLAADPELRHTQNGKPVARFTVIENRRRRMDNGWEDAEPNVFRVEVWAELAENVAESLHKGERAHVSGRIVTDRWDDKDRGAPRTAQLVVADEVSVSLRFHTAKATKATKSAPAEDDPQIPSWDVVQIPGEDNPY
jgi:single-strand DNA-binding protein